MCPATCFTKSSHERSAAVGRRARRYVAIRKPLVSEHGAPHSLKSSWSRVTDSVISLRHAADCQRAAHVEKSIDRIPRMNSFNRQIRLKSRPEGAPSIAHFDAVDAPMPVVQDGDVLRRTMFLSLDPYMRGRMSDAPSYAAPVEVG